MSTLLITRVETLPKSNYFYGHCRLKSCWMRMSCPLEKTLINLVFQTLWRKSLTTDNPKNIELIESRYSKTIYAKKCF